jgi:hypothetical protein
VRSSVAKNRHLQFTLREERLLVGNVLRRGAIQIETRPHRARLPIGPQILALC